MTCTIGINGFGRIGRMVLRRALELPDATVVAINDLAQISDLAYLFTYDSVHGIFPGQVSHTNHTLEVQGHSIRYFAEPEPAKVPWNSVGVDVVIEASGHFRKRAAAAQHLQSGVQKVLISAPADDADITIVPGVNEDHYVRGQHHIISMASCTTNSLAPVAKVHQEIVSVDLIGNTHSAVIDAPSTRVLHGTIAKILSWYDNEWGYACRLAELACRLI